MKNVFAVLFFISLIIASLLYIFRSESRENAPAPPVEETEEAAVEWLLEPPVRIVSPDFRNMNWGMDYYSIACQEEKNPDAITDNFMLYENTKFSVFENAKLYYFDSVNGCESAAYRITVSSDDSAYGFAEKTIETYLDEMYASPDAEDSPVRTTFSAVITYSFREEEDRKEFYIEFKMPEGFHDDYIDVTRQ